MFRNINVFWKFAIVAFLIPVAVVVTAGIALLNSESLKYEYDNLYGFMLIPIMDLDQGNLARASLEYHLYELTNLDPTSSKFTSVAGDVRQADQKMAAAIAKYEQEYATTNSPEFTETLVRLGKENLQSEETDLLRQYNSTYQGYAPKRDAILAGQSQDHDVLEADMAKLDEIFSRLVTINREFADLSNESAQGAINNMRVQIIAAGLLAALAAMAVTYAISRDITVPLDKGVQMIREMGRGHLSNRLRLDRRDEIGVLANTMDDFADDLQNNVIGGLRKIAYGDLNIVITPKDADDEISPAMLQTVESLRALEMATSFAATIAAGNIPAPITERYLGSFETLKDNLNALSAWLRQILSGISSTTNQLTSTSAEILAATTQQASGASEQSAAIAQTATTVDEVKAIAEQSRLRSEDVTRSAQRTVDVSRLGQQAMRDTITSMMQIRSRVEGIAENILSLSQQTQQIGEIIATVSEIAAQSNMLALNASVEAARAGEHGKGFAVVAMEVRALAEQSKTATSQVKTILSEIQKATNATVMATEEGTKGVEQGVHLATQAQSAIEQLSLAIKEASQAALQMSAGSQQQVTGVEQVATAMVNINQATMQNLASTRQAERAAQDLNSLAQVLNSLVKKYAL